MCKNIFFIFCLLWSLNANADPISPFSIGTTEVPNLPPPTCNLPAPTNLHTTVTGTTTLSFAWNQLVNSSGYDVVLTKVSTNQAVYAGHVTTEYVSIAGLESETGYKITVWSVCDSGLQGAAAELYETTDYVIVDDIVAGFQAFPSGILNTPHILNGTEELFVAKRTDSPVYAVFKIKKVENDDYVHVEFNNEEATASARWLIGGDSPQKIPYNNNSYKVSTVCIYNNTGLGQNLPKIKIGVQKFSDGQVQITWDAVTGYAIYSVTPPSLQVAETGDVITMKRQSVPVFDAAGSMKITTETPFSAVSGQVQISPNPFTDELVLQRNSGQSTQATVRIFDLNGRAVLQQVFDNETNTIRVPTLDLPTGLYVVRYEASDVVQMFKVFKSN